MNTLILKLNATGDVVRTTAVLHRLKGHVTWVTAERNTELLVGLDPRLRCLGWNERDVARDREYDLVISLEDEQEVAEFVQGTEHKRVFGARLDSNRNVTYSPDSKEWFDLSLISVHGKAMADRLKWKNRRTYQSMIFAGLGFEFRGEEYCLPRAPHTGLCGDVAIAPRAGTVWPSKNWAYFSDLKARLEGEGLGVNVLPLRTTLLEHLGDVCNHRCLVSGDSLPMHFALGTYTRCVSLFTCTSPWEIHDYGVQTKIVSPLLEEMFYTRAHDERATRAISVEDVFCAVLAALQESPVQRS